MTWKELLEYGTEQLLAHQIPDARLDAMYLLFDVCQISREDYWLECQRQATQEQVIAYKEKIATRASHVPLQHILGVQEFMGYEFKVNSHVLIPRQDTEILVETVLEEAREKRILDMCTGSGCILLSLCKLCAPALAVGVDLSLEALEVAQENAERLQCQASFIQSDLFEQVEGTYDVIVSNPPYIARDVIPTLMEEVKEHEPMLALDGGEDGLDFYREIVEQSVFYLVDGGILCFEIGYDQGSQVRDLMAQKGFQDIRVIKDLAGLDRVVIGHWVEEHG